MVEKTILENLRVKRIEPLIALNDLIHDFTSDLEGKLAWEAHALAVAMGSMLRDVAQELEKGEKEVPS